MDATFGRGGHSRAILSQLSPQGRLVIFDKDPEAIAEAGRIADARLSIRHEGFRHIGELPAGSACGVLMDLGVSSPQIDNPERGFSFRHDGPLDMRMDTTRGQSAAQWLATAEVGQIAQVIRDYGEERFAVPIAKAIAARRQERGPLASTAELAELVAGTVKTREPGQNPATRTFQPAPLPVALFQRSIALLPLVLSDLNHLLMRFKQMQQSTQVIQVARSLIPTVGLLELTLQ